MTIGTKTLLFGAHQFLLHPLFVALAWFRLFGFPWDPRLWVAFLVHDWGYFGLKALDDADGEKHVERGARIMRRLFGPHFGVFCLLHSRSYAKRFNVPVSQLCLADKLSVCYMPAWLYLPLVRLTGEIHEYKALARSGKYQGTAFGSDKEWYRSMRGRMRAWVLEAQKHGGLVTLKGVS